MGIPLRLASKVWSALKTKVVLPFLKPKRVRFSSSLASSTPAAATPPAWARKFWLSKNGAHTGVAPTAHEFALGDGLAAEDRTEEVVEDVAPCCESCASVARIEVLAKGVEGAA